MNNLSLCYPIMLLILKYSILFMFNCFIMKFLEIMHIRIIVSVLSPDQYSCTQNKIFTGSLFMRAFTACRSARGPLA